MTMRWPAYCLAITSLFSMNAAASNDDLDIFGFLSVGVAGMDKQDVTIGEFDGKGNFKQDTLFALQVSKQVNETTSATGQLISRGADDFDTKTAWAFVTYQPNQDRAIRMGRLRIPFFSYSEFLEVGYAYNWVRPPIDVYSITFSSFDGVDLTQNFSVGALDGSIQLNYGRFTDDLNIFDEEYASELDNVAGVSLDFYAGNWGFRLGAQQTEMTLDSKTDEATMAALQAFLEAGAKAQAGDLAAAATIPDLQAAFEEKRAELVNLRRIDQAQTGAKIIALTDASISADTADDFVFDGHKANFYNAALTYDNGSFSFVTEFAGLQYESGLLVDNRAWLASAAQRFGDTTVHLTYSTSRDVLDSGEGGKLQKALNLQGEDKSVTLGFRYDYDVNTALKLEAQHHDELVNRGVEGDQAILYSVAVDVIF